MDFTANYGKPRSDGNADEDREEGGGVSEIPRVSNFAMNKLLAYCSSVEGSNIQIFREIEFK